MWIGNDVWAKSLSLLRSWRLLFEREGAPTEAVRFNFERDECYYSASTQKKEKVHACYPRGKASFFTWRRYRVISPFLFFEKTCKKAFLCPDGGYAGRSEDGAWLRL